MRHARVTKIVPNRDVLRVFFSGVRGWRVRWCEIVDPSTYDMTFFEGDIWDADTRTLVSRNGEWNEKGLAHR